MSKRKPKQTKRKNRSTGMSPIPTPEEIAELAAAIRADNEASGDARKRRGLETPPVEIAVVHDWREDTTYVRRWIHDDE